MGYLGGPVHCHEMFGICGVGRRSVSAGGKDGGRRRHLLRLIVAHYSGVRRLQDFRDCAPAMTCQPMAPGFVKAFDEVCHGKRAIARLISAVCAIIVLNSRT